MHRKDSIPSMYVVRTCHVVSDQMVVRIVMNGGEDSDEW
jgi:hypothetical protein